MFLAMTISLVDESPLRPWVHPRRMFLASGSQTDPISPQSPITSDAVVTDRSVQELDTAKLNELNTEIDAINSWLEQYETAPGKSTRTEPPVSKNAKLARLTLTINKFINSTQKSPAVQSLPSSESISAGPVPVHFLSCNVGDSMDLARLRDIRQHCRNLFEQAPLIPQSPVSSRSSPWLEQLEPSVCRSRLPEFTVTRRYPTLSVNRPPIPSTPITQNPPSPNRPTDSPVNARHIVKWLKKVSRDASPARLRAEEVLRR